MARYMPEGWALPAIDRFNRPYFTSGKLMLQECATCGNVQHPPEHACHACQGMEFSARECPGGGVIYSFVIVHHAGSPLLAGRVPFNVAVIKPDAFEHIRIVGNVVDAAPEEMEIGRGVSLTFDEVDDPASGERLLIPQWKLA